MIGVEPVFEDRELVSEREHRLVSRFLYREAQLLDSNRFNDWLALVADDIHYRLTGPIISMWKTAPDKPPPEVLLLDERMGSFKTRVKQLSTASYTVAENPRSSTRRFVTNIIVEQGDSQSLLAAASNVLVYRTRDPQSRPDLFAISRQDVLRRHGKGFRLVSREAQLAEVVIGSRNIATLF